MLSFVAFFWDNVIASFDCVRMATASQWIEQEQENTKARIDQSTAEHRKKMDALREEHKAIVADKNSRIQALEVSLSKEQAKRRDYLFNLSINLASLSKEVEEERKKHYS